MQSISQQIVQSQRRGAGCLTAFGLLFAAFGMFFVFMFTIRPAYLATQARDWLATPCTIISSRIDESSDSDHGTTYSPDVEYEYVFNDRTYRSHDYDFAKISGGHASAQAVLNRFPVGSTQTCYVDPQSASRAVLDRDFVPGFASLMVLVFPTVGLLVAYAGYRQSRRPAAMLSTPAVAASFLPEPAGSATPRTVPQTAALLPSPFPTRNDGITLMPDNRAQTIILVVVAVIWNGFAWSIFLLNGVSAGIAPTAFLGLFLLAGLVIAVVTVLQVMKTLGPRPILIAATPSVPLGGTLQLRWSYNRNPQAVTRLTFALVGREEATSRRGTDTSTDKSIFYRVLCFEGTSMPTIATGQLAIPIPPDTIHSFQSKNNKIVWTIEVQQTITNWPDTRTNHKITITPQTMEPPYA